MLPSPRSKAEQAAAASFSKAARSPLGLETWSVAMNGFRVLYEAVTSVVSIGGTLLM